MQPADLPDPWHCPSCVLGAGHDNKVVVAAVAGIADPPRNSTPAPQKCDDKAKKSDLIGQFPYFHIEVFWGDVHHDETFPYLHSYKLVSFVNLVPPITQE